MRKFLQRRRKAFDNNTDALPSALRFVYKWVEDEPLTTDVYLPVEESERPLPVLMMIHGGAFMLGESKQNNEDQIGDCLARGWIVVSVQHRVCPAVDILQAMADVRDALKWIQSGGLTRALDQAFVLIMPDIERIMAVGISSGGHLALSLVCYHFIIDHASSLTITGL